MTDTKINEKYEKFKQRWQDKVTALTTEDLETILDGEPITEANLKALEAVGAIGKVEIEWKLPAYVGGLVFRVEPDTVHLVVNPRLIEKAEDSPSA